MRAFAAVAVALCCLFVERVAGTPASAVVRQAQADYRSALIDEVCAGQAAGANDPRLIEQRRRLAALVRRAERGGIGAALRQTKREWDYFQTVADWVCGHGASVARFRLTIDRLERSINAAIGVRGRR